MAALELGTNRETEDPADPSSPQRVQVVCKLADFGESRSVVVSATGRDNLGNPLWLAPEVIRSEVCVTSFIFSPSLYPLSLLPLSLLSKEGLHR